MPQVKKIQSFDFNSIWDRNLGSFVPFSNKCQLKKGSKEKANAIKKKQESKQQNLVEKKLIDKNKPIVDQPNNESDTDYLQLTDEGPPVLFKDVIVSFEFGKMKLNEKNNLKDLILKNGGIISHIINKQSKYLIVADGCSLDSYKVRTAVKLNVPVLSVDFLQDCDRHKKLVNPENYKLTGETRSDQLKAGKIVVEQDKCKQPSVKLPSVNLDTFPVYNTSEETNEQFLEAAYRIAKFAILKGSTRYHVIELQVSRDERIYRVTHQCLSAEPLIEEYHRCYLTADGRTALAIYSRLHTDSKATPLHDFSQLPTVGSEKLQQILVGLGSQDGKLHVSISRLVRMLWRESIGEITTQLKTPLNKLRASQLEKAEGILLRLRLAISASNTSEKQSLVAELNSTLERRDCSEIRSISDVARLLSLCQLCRDVVAAAEELRWRSLDDSGSTTLYRALSCSLTLLPPNTTEHKQLRDRISERPDACEYPRVKTLNIWKLERETETDNFQKELGNRKLLFHSSAAKNFIGILTRGLLPPRVQTTEVGVSRTDAGMLGAGIYFAPYASTSAQYSRASSTGSRFLLVCDVALGSVQSVGEAQKPEMTHFEGANSLKADPSISPNFFKDEEYCIYSAAQQRCVYLVEFCLSTDPAPSYDDELQINSTNQNEDIELQTQDAELLLKEVQGIPDPALKVEAGLQGDSITLRSVQIRAQLIDLAVKVVLFQEYYNSSTSALEAKYVFPLDETAAVCGFEAFINGKHVVGKVKEKEKAHVEYKKAVSEGHGAYLMDQDEETPEVFSISVGNLPAGAVVQIKLTYVTELQLNAEKLVFRLPAAVAPWTKQNALADKTQDTTETAQVEAGDLGLELSVQMPYDIRSIQSDTHRIEVKETSTQAVVRLADKPATLGVAGFELSVTLAEVHAPRLWVENHPDDSQACMFTFYPEFSGVQSHACDVIILIDRSNSMDSALRSAQQLALLLLASLPQTTLFNVAAFGSDYREVFPAPQTLTSRTLRSAREFVLNLQPGGGGTDLSSCLRSISAIPPVTSQRSVLLISDGHVSGGMELLDLVKRKNHVTRIFSCGVSDTANRHRLRMLARAGNGAYEYFDTKTKSKWQSLAGTQVNRSQQLVLENVRVEWKQHTEAESSVQGPSLIPALFNGYRQIVYAFTTGCNQATLYATVDGHEVSTTVYTSELAHTQGKMIHALTARSVIRDWEEGLLDTQPDKHQAEKEGRKSHVIELSTRHNVVCSLTSFIAVEERQEGEQYDASKSVTLFELVKSEDVDLLPYVSWPSTSPRRSTSLISSSDTEDSESVYENYGVDVALSTESVSGEWEEEDEEYCDMEMQDEDLFHSIQASPSYSPTSPVHESLEPEKFVETEWSKIPVWELTEESPKSAEFRSDEISSRFKSRKTHGGMPGSQIEPRAAGVSLEAARDVSFADVSSMITDQACSESRPLPSKHQFYSMPAMHSLMPLSRRLGGKLIESIDKGDVDYTQSTRATSDSHQPTINLEATSTCLLPSVPGEVSGNFPERELYSVGGSRGTGRRHRVKRGEPDDVVVDGGGGDGRSRSLRSPAASQPQPRQMMLQPQAQSEPEEKSKPELGAVSADLSQFQDRKQSLFLRKEKLEKLRKEKLEQVELKTASLKSAESFSIASDMLESAATANADVLSAFPLSSGFGSRKFPASFGVGPPSPPGTASLRARRPPPPPAAAAVCGAVPPPPPPPAAASRAVPPPPPPAAAAFGAVPPPPLAAAEFTASLPPPPLPPKALEPLRAPLNFSSGPPVMATSGAPIPPHVYQAKMKRLREKKTSPDNKKLTVVDFLKQDMSRSENLVAVKPQAKLDAARGKKEVSDAISKPMPAERLSARHQVISADDEGEDEYYMGFGLFDSDEPVVKSKESSEADVQTASVELLRAKKKAKKKFMFQSAEEESPQKAIRFQPQARIRARCGFSARLAAAEPQGTSLSELDVLNETNSSSAYNEQAANIELLRSSVDQVLDRGETLDEICEKSQTLEADARVFRLCKAKKHRAMFIPSIMRSSGKPAEFKLNSSLAEELMESKEDNGGWSLDNSSLKTLIGSKISVMQSLIKSAGIQSLGVRVSREVQWLVSALAVLLLVLRRWHSEVLSAARPQVSALGSRLQRYLEQLSSDGSDTQAAGRLLYYCFDLAMRLSPMMSEVCSNLELGHTWEEFVIGQL